MRRARWVMAGLLCWTAAMGARAQDVLHVDEATMRSHVQNEVTPVYPPIAKAAEIQGTVKLEMKVGRTGAVDWVKLVSGPGMLQQAAMDSARRWTFKPFMQGGGAVEAQGTVSVVFSLGRNGPTAEETRLAEKYFPEANQCEKAVMAQADMATAETLCVQAAEDADRFPEERRFIERRSSFVWAAWALLYQGNYAGAEGWARRAVNVVKLGHDDNAGANSAYAALAMAMAKTGNLMESDRNFEVAEEYERKALASVEDTKSGIAESYRRAIAHDLKIHAQVLKAMTRPEDAQKKLDEAAKYE